MRRTIIILIYTELIEVQEQFPHLFEQLMKCGWNVKSGITYIEDNDAHRIHIKTFS